MNQLVLLINFLGLLLLEPFFAGDLSITQNIPTTMEPGTEVRVTVTVEQGTLSRFRETAARSATRHDGHGHRDQGSLFHLRRSKGEIHLDGPSEHTDVYKELLNDGEDIGLATVYRVLTQFEQAGLLERHLFESGKAVFELKRGGHHDHLVCLQCGRVEEFCDSKIEQRQEAIANDRGFRLQEPSLSLYADCIKPACPHRK